MKAAVAVLAPLLCAASLSLSAAPADWLNKPIPKLVLADGREYSDVTITEIAVDSIAIRHAGGVGRVPMEALKPESQAALGYDPAKAAEARKAAKEAADAAAMNQIVAGIAAAPAIPGLAAVDLHGNLTPKGFELTKNLGGVQSEWKCQLVDGLLNYVAEAFGPSASKITSVKATVYGVSASGIDQDAAEFLGFVASLPYDGADPAKARAWVAANVGRSAETVIGGVTFQTFANSPNARMLRIAVK